MTSAYVDWDDERNEGTVYAGTLYLTACGLPSDLNAEPDDDPGEYEEDAPASGVEPVPYRDDDE